MFLTTGITLPENILTPLTELQRSFWTENWEPLPFLMIPLCVIGTVTSPTLIEELDHALSTLRTDSDIIFQPEQFDVFSYNDTISLELRVTSPPLELLGMKIGKTAKRIGIKTARVIKPLTIPFCRITDVDPEDISAWMQLHYALKLPAATFSALTLFSSQKTGKTVHYSEEEKYSAGAFSA